MYTLGAFEGAAGCILGMRTCKYETSEVLLMFKPINWCVIGTDATEHIYHAFKDRKKFHLITRASLHRFHHHKAATTAFYNSSQLS